MISKIKANPTFALVWVIVHMFLVGAAAVSFMHIVTVSERLGVHDWQAFTVPFLIDGIAILGKIGRSRKFAEKTRSAGLVLMGLGGIVSLAANIEAGENVGQKAYGALLVGGFVLAEWYAGKLEAAPPPAAPAAESKARKVSEAEQAARKRAGWAKMSPADKRSWTKSYRSRIAQRTAATAPTSPGYGPVSAPPAAVLENAVR